MSKNDTHPSDASYQAGVDYANDNCIDMAEGDVRAYARSHAEDVEAFVDGYWTTVHAR